MCKKSLSGEYSMIASGGTEEMYVGDDGKAFLLYNGVENT